MNTRNSTSKIWQEIGKEVGRRNNIIEPRSVVREIRQGFRGLGFYQLGRIYSAEGVYVAGIGGPPIVGR